MLFKDISYLELWRPLFQQSRTICAILVEGNMRSNSAELFSLGPVVREWMLFIDIYNLDLWLPLCSLERYHLCNFGRRDNEEHFCEITLNLDL